MPIWTKDRAPYYAPNAVQTASGWTDKDTGEVLVAISDLDEKGGAANIVSVVFDAESYVSGDTVEVTVTYSEKVDASNDETLVVSILDAIDGVTETVTLTSAASTDSYDVVFSGTIEDKDSGTLSIEDQTISGSIADSDGADTSALALASVTATATYTGKAKVVSAAFSQPLGYDNGDTLAVTLTYDQNVTATGDEEIVVTDSDNTDHTLVASVSSGSTDVVFTEASALAGTTSSTLSLDAQTITNDIEDDGANDTLANPTILDGLVADVDYTYTA